MVLTALLGAGLAIYLSIPESPASEIEQARSTIQEAKKNIHSDFVPPSLHEAELLYDTAMSKWKKENERFFLFRNYDTIVVLARKSKELAMDSPRLASLHHDDFAENLAVDLEELGVLSKKHQWLISKLPIDKRTSNLFARGTIELAEAYQALNRGQMKESRRIVDDARKNLEQSVHKTLDLLENYFESFPVWEKTAREAINQSARSRSTMILVDKMAARCEVYSKGKLVAGFDAEFGPNWIGTKHYSGDDATPEGVYKVTKKKEGRNTKYYKALLIDYPNPSDKVRFNEGIREGRIARNAKIGGLIEIHGHGGKGTHWTNGCVALLDSDMARLYSLVSINTPVIIVGSLTPLDKIINQ